MRSKRFTIIVIFPLFLVTSCFNSGQKHKNQAMKIAEEYVMSHMKEAVREESNGVIIFKDENRRFIIDPLSVFTGNIDDDNSKDAIITVISYEGNYLGVIEHLIIININGSLIMQKSIESDMKILDLKDGLITAEVPTHPRSSPLFNCPKCREVITFRYKNGELVKSE